MENKYQEAFNKLKEQVSFNNVDELILVKELIEKNATEKEVVPLKEKEYGYKHKCPNCGKYVGTIILGEIGTNSGKYMVLGIDKDDFCPSCGQKLKWGDTDD